MTKSTFFNNHSKINWKQIVRERDGNRCTNSEDDSIRNHNTELNVHHVLPKKYGGQDEPSNGVLLCRNCHAAMHPEIEQLYFAKSLMNFIEFIQSWFHNLFGKSNHIKYLKALELLTGAKQFRPQQEYIVGDIIENKNSVIVVMPTGSGKSVLYQIPGLLSSGQSLVLSPLISLMTDQVKHLKSKWIPCTYINSTLSKVEKKKRLENITAGNYKFVFAHPKQFLRENEDGEMILKTSNPLLLANYRYLIVDEVHLMNSWGRAFIKEYANLKMIAEGLDSPQLILLTATASRSIQDKIVDLLGKEEINRYVSGFYRPELTLEVIELGSETAKIYKIMEIIDQNKSGKVLIFVPTIKIGDSLLKFLQDKGYQLDFYHGQLNKDKRHKIQMLFSGDFKPELNFLIATNAFGMGVDIPNIREIIFYSMPSNIVDYYQQAGRAGRDGLPSTATLLYASGDESLNAFLNNITTREIKNEEEKIIVEKELGEELRDMLGFIDAKDKWQYILDYFGEKQKFSLFTRLESFYGPLLLIVIILLVYWFLFLY